VEAPPSSAPTPFGDVATGSGSTRKRKPIEEPQSEVASPRKIKRQRHRNRDTKSKATRSPSAQGTNTTKASPEFAFVYESGLRRKPRRAVEHLDADPLETHTQEDPRGYACVPKMYSDQEMGCNTSIPSSTSTSHNPASPAADFQGKGKRNRLEPVASSSTANTFPPCPSKPDRKGKRKAGNGDLHGADTPQVPTSTGSRPLVRVHCRSGNIFSVTQLYLIRWVARRPRSTERQNDFLEISRLPPYLPLWFVPLLWFTNSWIIIDLLL